MMTQNPAMTQETALAGKLGGCVASVSHYFKHARRQPSIGKFHNYTGMTNSGAVSVGRNASHLGRGITHGTASGSSSRTVNTRCAIARAFTGQRSIGG